jgi:hypothetical protein
VDALAQAPAVELFVQRARAANRAFALSQTNAHAVAEICARLDGLPLALELAAARIRALPPAALLAQLGRMLGPLGQGLRDMPARHQTLRAAIDASFDLLSGAEQALLRRLAVFTGGWSLEAALRQRHFAWALGLAKQAERHHWGPEQVVWWDRLELELPNLRAALSGAGGPTTVKRACGSRPRCGASGMPVATWWRDAAGWRSS